MKKIVYIFLLTAIIFGGCATTKHVKIESLAPPFIPEVKLFPEKDSLMMTFTLSASAERETDKIAFMNSISKIRAVLINEIGRAIDTVSFPPPVTSGISSQKNSASVTLHTRLKYGNRQYKDFSGFTIKYLIESGENVYNIKKEYFDLLINPKSDKPAIELFPFVNQLGNQKIEIGMLALRNKEVEKEYMPSSEDFRVEIYSEKGILVWNSSSGMNFLQVIRLVFPEKPGESHRYEMEWDGRKDNGNQAAPGEYNVIMTIPAKPAPYIATMKFQWQVEGND